MSKDNGHIEIDNKTQELVRNLRIQIAQLQSRLNDVLTTVYNVSGKDGNYQPSNDFTRLELVKDETVGTSNKTSK